MLTIFNSSQAHMKRGWNLLLPQIEQSESLCKTQIIFENLPESTLGFDSGYMLINPSRDVCNSYSKSVRLGRFKSVENDYFNGDRIKIRAQASTFFSLPFFLYYIDIL